MVNSGIIEIIGPPGVGKTTIYDFLCKTWNPVFNWTYQEAALAPKPSVTSLDKWIYYNIAKLLKKRAARTIPVEYGIRFIHSHPELSRFCWDYLAEVYKDDMAKRFRLAYFLFYDFCRYQALLECALQKPCVINEGLLQKSVFVDDDDANVLHQLQAYYSLLPLPYAVINIKVDNSEVIVDRLQNRGKVIASHAGKNTSALLSDVEKWQAIERTIIEIMSKRGVKVFEVNGERPIAENVSYIKELLKTTA